MFPRSRPSPPREDPCVAAVEQLLAAAAARGSGAVPARDGRAVVTHALWICACVTLKDAPTWLIHDLPDEGLAWRRVPDTVEPLDLVDARRTAGGHADPAEVLRWMQGAASHPWCGGGYGCGDAVVLEVLRRKIRSE